MNQKLEASPRQPLPADDDQHVGAPHFELNRDSVDSSVSQRQYIGNQLLDRELAQPYARENDTDNILVTVLMPCLNEARTLAACIQQAHAGCQTALSHRNINRHALASGCTSRQCDDEQSATGPTPEFNYEILIADNGSTDGSPEIAVENGASVVHVEQKGYGSALRGGIAAARGRYIVMGDSDCSYDFGEVRRFLTKLEEGYDLVMGNRFAGCIFPGAMPWHHRYVGNPVLSGVGRFLYRTPCRDWHCGLRAFEREKINSLNMHCTGMEFASELVICASRGGLRVTEIATTLKPDGRDRPPHLRSICDGWRHLSLLLRFAFQNRKVQCG